MPALPVVLALRSRLIGMDPDTGARAWEHELPQPAYRLFLAGPWLFVAVGALEPEGALLRFDRATGTPSGRIDLGFRATAGVVDGDRLVLASRYGAASVSTEGVVLWHAKVEGIVTSSQELVARDAHGRELWRRRLAAPASDENVGLVVADVVCQPDVR